MSSALPKRARTSRCRASGAVSQASVDDHPLKLAATNGLPARPPSFRMTAGMRWVLRVGVTSTRFSRPVNTSTCPLISSSALNDLHLPAGRFSASRQYSDEPSGSGRGAKLSTGLTLPVRAQAACCANKQCADGEQGEQGGPQANNLSVAMNLCGGWKHEDCAVYPLLRRNRTRQ